MEKMLPKGWVETSLGNLCLIERGGSPRPITDFITTEINGINWIKISDASSSNRYIFKTKEKIKKEGLKKSRFVNIDDLILSNSMSFGRPYILKTSGCIHDGWLVLKKKIKNSYSSDFMYYLLSSSYMYNQFDVLASGSTVRNLNKDLVSSSTIKLPPFAEQERIVAKLDVLFAQHEVMKKALERIPQLLKNFRQQVLNQAVTGKLTEEWREGKELDEWKELIINDICDSIVPGRDKPKSFTGDIPWITTPNITTKYINNSNAHLFLSRKEIKDVRAKIIPINSVIMTIVGKFGIAAIIKEESVINQQLHAFLPSKKIIPEFLLYNIKTKESYFQSISSATTIAYINKTKANSLPISLPPLIEQQEIVSRVESLFEKVDEIEARHIKLKANIESLPQALLHKAFRGELVPQLPTDGDAKDLLAEIMALKKEVKKKK